MVRPKSPETQKLRERAVELLLSGRTQSEVAKILNRDVRTVQKWLVRPEIKELLESKGRERKALVVSDPVVLSLTEVRQQIEEILSYRESQKTFATEMGEVVVRAVRVLKAAVERLEANPDELSIRSIPPFLKAVTDAAQKVSDAWGRSVGLDDLLQRIEEDEPKAISQGEGKI